MSHPIFYEPACGATDLITLAEDASRHVVQVLRMKPGEILQLTDGKGTLATALVIESHKKMCTVKVSDRQFTPCAARQVSIGISLLKNVARFEWFLEKATEIGVTEIIPLKCERTEKQHFRYDRMNNIVIAAMIQSQQNWLPVLHEPRVYNEVVSQSAYPIKLIAHCEDQPRFMVTQFARSSSVQVLIGPEGDFSPVEIERALHYGHKPVMLGNTRLRSETAGVVAATLLCTPGG